MNLKNLGEHPLSVVIPSFLPGDVAKPVGFWAAKRRDWATHCSFHLPSVLANKCICPPLTDVIFSCLSMCPCGIKNEFTRDLITVWVWLSLRVAWLNRSCCDCSVWVCFFKYHLLIVRLWTTWPTGQSLWGSKTVYETVVSNTGAPQGMVLLSFLFTLYTSHFQYNTSSCHVQKLPDDFTIMRCIHNGEESEYRGLVEVFVLRCKENNLQLKIRKTGAGGGRLACERASKTGNHSVGGSGDGAVLQVLGGWPELHIGLDRQQYSRLLGRTVDYGQCLHCSITEGEAMHHNKLIRKANSITELTLETITEKRMVAQLEIIMNSSANPLHGALS